MCGIVGFIGFMLVIGGWALYRARDDPVQMLAQACRALGVFLPLGSFLFLPWVIFAPGQYLVNALSGVLPGYVLELVPRLLGLLGLKEIERVLSWIESLGGAPAWMLVIVPTFGWLLRLTLLLIPLLAGLGLLWLLLTSFLTPGAEVRRIVGLVQALLAGLVALLLLFEMPAIDSLHARGNVYLRTLVVLAGARLTPFVWLAWFGLMLLAVGGGIEALHAQPAPPAPRYLRRPAPVHRKSAPPITGAVMVAIGAVAILGSVFFAPWIHFIHRDASLTRIVQGVSDPLIQNSIKALNRLVTLPASPPIRNLADTRKNLTGWALWRAAPVMPGLLRWSIALAAVLACAGLAWAALAWFGAAGGEWLTWVSLAYAMMAGVLFLALVGHVPTLETFGVQDDFGVVWACLLTSTQMGPGIWLALFGLVMIAIGGGMDFVASKGGSP